MLFSHETICGFSGTYKILWKNYAHYCTCTNLKCGIYYTLFVMCSRSKCLSIFSKSNKFLNIYHKRSTLFLKVKQKAYLVFF